MKLWRSPVFYFGVLLVLAVAGALVAPYVVDWARYRPALEHYATELTGASVENVDTSVKLGQSYEDLARRIPDNTKARTVLGWRPIFSLDAGLRRTIEWYRSAFDAEQAA